MAAKFVIAFAVVGAVSGLRIKRQSNPLEYGEYMNQFESFTKPIQGGNFPTMPSNFNQFPGMGSSSSASSSAAPTKRQAPNPSEMFSQFESFTKPIQGGNFPTMPSNFNELPGMGSSSSASSSSAAPSKRQAPNPSEMFSQFESFTKPIQGGNFPTMPSNFNELPGMGSSSSASSSAAPSKRQAPNPSEMFSQFESFTKPIQGGNFPTMPSNFNELPGMGSSSSASSSSAAPSKRQAPNPSEMFSQFESFTKPIQGGNFPTMPSNFNELPGMGSSSSASSSSAAPSKRQAPNPSEMFSQFESFTKPIQGGNFPTMPSNFNELPGMGSSSSASSSSAAPSKRQAPNPSEMFSQFESFTKPIQGGNFPTMPSNFNELPGMGSSSSASSASAAPSKRQAPNPSEMFSQFESFTKPIQGGNFPTMPSNFNELPGMGSSSSASSSSAAPSKRQAPNPSEMFSQFNQFESFTKPIQGGHFPTMPSNFNELPGMGSSSSSSASSSAAAPTKRQAPNPSEMFSQFESFTKPIQGGNFPTMPSNFNELPGMGSSSSASSSSAAPTKRQSNPTEMFSQFNQFEGYTKPSTGSFPSPGSNFGGGMPSFPGGAGSSNAASASSS